MTRSAIALIALALVAASCGDSASDDSVATLEKTPTATNATTATDAGLEGEEAVLEYVQCLRDEGLEIQDPDLVKQGSLGLRREFVDDPGDPLPNNVEAAFEACENLRSDFSQRFERVDPSETEDRLLAFAQCMRDEGVTDFPDPDLSVWAPGAGLGPGNGPFGEAIFELEGDAGASSALKTCQASYGGAGTGQGGG